MEKPLKKKLDIPKSKKSETIKELNKNWRLKKFSATSTVESKGNVNELSEVKTNQTTEIKESYLNFDEEKDDELSYFEDINRNLENYKSLSSDNSESMSPERKFSSIQNPLFEMAEQLNVILTVDSRANDLDQETTSLSSSSANSFPSPFKQRDKRDILTNHKDCSLSSSKSSFSMSLGSYNLKAEPSAVEEKTQPQVADTSLTYYDDFYVGSKFNRMRKLDSTWTTNNVSKNSSDLHLKYESSLQSSKTDRSTLRKQMRDRKERELSQLRSSSESELSTSKRNTSSTKKENQWDNLTPTKRPFSCNFRSSTRKAHVDLNMLSDLDEYETLNKFNKLERFKRGQKLMRIQQLHLKQSSLNCFKDVSTTQTCFNSLLDSQSFHINRLDDYLLVKIFSKLDTIQILRLQFVCRRWHQVVWSSENAYKLFNHIELCAKSSNFYKTKPQSVQSAITHRAQRKRKSDESNNSKVKFINADKLLYFLLGKMLNRQTFPLCLCVEYIKIKRNLHLTDKSIRLIAQVCPELKFLSLRHCVNIGKESIGILISNCPNLYYLDLSGCTKIINIIKPNIDAANKRKASFEFDSNKDFNKSTQNGFIRFFLTRISSISTGTKKPVVMQKPNTQTNEPKPKSILKPSNPNVEYLYLSFVDLSFCTLIDDKCVELICKKCIYLKNLYLRACKRLTDESLRHVSENCSNLKELSVSQCSKLTDFGIKYLGITNRKSDENKSNAFSSDSIDTYREQLRLKIKCLSLAKCELITDQSLVFLCQVGFFKQIKYLNLKGCLGISDRFVRYFCGLEDRTSIPMQLKSLDFSKCLITDKSLEYICYLSRFKSDKLKRLLLDGCKQITDEGIKLLAQPLSTSSNSSVMRRLRFLNIKNCNKITRETIDEIKQEFKQCSIVFCSFSNC